jgi:hypothetical protein
LISDVLNLPATGIIFYAKKRDLQVYENSNKVVATEGRKPDVLAEWALSVIKELQ